MSTTPTPGPSTSPSPGTFSQPATGWYPQLSGLQLPQALTNGMTQSYSLIYSLRDTVNLLQAAVAKLLQYGTEKTRQQVNPQSVPDGALWFDTDTGDVYQARLNQNSTTRDWIHVLAGIPGAPGA